MKIKTVLQTCDEPNKNKRIYPKSVLMNGIEKIRPLIEQHALTGELDHPVPSSNSETDSYRHFVVLYQNTSHIIEDIYFEGDKVMGIVKTASTQKGKDMAGLILDGVPVGFSLRAMGESEVNSSGITTIKEPFEVVTYDCVSNPSHAKARMVSRVSECALVVPKAKILTENAFGSITLDRSGLLYGYNKASKSLDAKLQDLMENINSLTTTKQKKTIDSNKVILGLLEAYLNDDKDDPGKSYHNKMIEYLNDYLDTDRDEKYKKDPELKYKDFFNKYFN